MKPSQLAAELVGIVIRHTDSRNVWREAELTDQERVAIGAELERFIRADFDAWKASMSERGYDQP